MGILSKRKMEGILSLAIILIFLTACSQQIILKNETMQKNESETMNNSESFENESGTINNSKSLEYAKKIEKLKENALPKEWYLVDESVKLPERWDAIASQIYNSVMKNAPPGKFFFSNERIKEMYLSYNGTFKSTKNDSITVISAEKNLFVTISKDEMQKIVDKKAEFDAEKLNILEKIFG